MWVGKNHQLILEKRVRLQIHVFRKGGHDVDIVLIGLHPLDDSCPVARLELWHHLGIAAQEGPQVVGQEIFGGGHRGQIERAGHFTSQLIQLPFEGVKAFEYVLAGGIELLAGGGQIDFLAHLLK